MNVRHLWVALLMCTSMATMSQTNTNNSTENSKPTVKPWYENFSIRGYMQVRYNRLFETNSELKCEQCDKSWGDKGGIAIRRGRIILSGNLTKNVYFYIQPDFGSSTGTTLNIFQLRDAYIDFAFDAKNEFRIRLGQSKVPFGFENLQSSQNRMALDRNDALNSALSNERDLGAFFYWAPEKTRKLFASLVSDNFKGSGDYGVFAFGVYNGQTANKPEQNNTLHVVSRISLPLKLGSQLIEPGVQAYAGKFVLPLESRTTTTKGVKSFEFDDKRVAGSFILYPKPFGIQAEYTVGKGPQYNPATDSIETKNLKGGYVTLSMKIAGKNNQYFFPYSRYQYYNGGKKHELDARSYEVREVETGVEWQINKNFELTTSYVISSRRFEDAKLKSNSQKGNLLRIQAQMNF